MNFKIDSVHNVDPATNLPKDGHTNAPGLTIAWHLCSVEAVLVAAADRLQFYQNLKFKCPETRRALLKIHEALAELSARTADRETRGVEGTTKA